MITKQKFESLLNGGGAAAGVKGLSLEIRALEMEVETARAELDAMPAKRADLILADNATALLDKLENRERELERLVERNTLQIGPLRDRVSHLRRTELLPRIAHHQKALAKIEDDIAAAVQTLMDLNRNAVKALESAVAELGDDGVPLLISPAYGGLATDICFEMWRGNIAAQRARITNAQATGRNYPTLRTPAFDLDALRPPAVR